MKCLSRFYRRGAEIIAGVTGFIGASVISGICEPPPPNPFDVSTITFDASPVQTLGLGVLGALALIFIVKKAAGFLGSRG